MLIELPKKVGGRDNESKDNVAGWIVEAALPEVYAKYFQDKSFINRCPVDFDIIAEKTYNWNWQGGSAPLFLQMKANGADYRSIVRKVAVKNGSVDTDQVAKKYHELMALYEAGQSKRNGDMAAKTLREIKRQDVLKRAGVIEPNGRTATSVDETGQYKVKFYDLTEKQAEQLLTFAVALLAKEECNGVIFLEPKS